MNKAKLHVLLVDDNENDYIITRELLAYIDPQKFKLEWVGTYQDGLEAISRRAHDVYLIDYRLGRNNGLELLREAIKRGCTAPLILLTGQGEHKIDLEAMQSGAADYLVKDQLDAPLLERSMRYALEQKRSQAALRASEQRFRELVEKLQVGVLLLDDHAKILLTNQAALDLFGLAKEQLSGHQDLSRLFGDDTIHEDGTPFPFESHPVAMALKTRQPVHNVVMGVKPASGQPVWLLVNAEPQLSNGNVHQVICSFSDMTERKAAEEERRYTKQLRVAAEVSEQISAILEPDDLLSVTASLLQERFNLYHVHVYLLVGGQLVMQVGSGKEEEPLRARNHTIRFEDEHSLVARVARSKQAILVNDTRRSDTFMPNPLLSNTRSEVAVPLMVGQKLLGVLDVQDKQPNRFTQADLDVFNTLAGHLATALENARLFSEQKRSEAALRESEERLRFLSEAASEGIAIHEGGIILTANSALARIFGYELSEMVGMSLLSLATPASRETIRKNLAAGRKEPYEVDGHRKDGSIIWFELQGHALSYKGRSARVALVRDITERKRAEEELRRFTNQLRTAADLAQQINAILDLDELLAESVAQLHFRFSIDHLHIYLLDETRQQLVMHTGSGEVGKLLRQRGHAIPFSRRESLVARAARKQEIVLVNEVRNEPTFMSNPLLPDTRSEVAVPLIVGERVLGVFDMQDDKPERFTPAELDVLRTLAGQVATAIQNARLFEQVQQSLEQTRIRFQVSQALAKAQTEEEVLDAIIEQASFYSGTRITLVTTDEQEEQTFIVRRSRSFGRHKTRLEEGQRFTSENYPIIQHLTADQPFVSSNVCLDKRVDPRTRELAHTSGTVSLALLPLSVGDNWLGTMALSSGKEGFFSNQSTLYLYQSLAQQGAVALRSAQLFDETQRTSEHLRELDRLKSEFLANMSHELRTPLSSIIGYSEIMLMGLNGPLNEEMTEDIEAIRNSGQHLLRLINDILDLAKIEAGRMTFGIEEVDLSRVLDEIRVSHSALLHQKKITLGGTSEPLQLVIEIDKEVPTIQADSLRLNQILTNLVSNAIKFTEKGIIRLHATHDDGWVEISVQDQGIGIKESDLTTIFEQFRQVDGGHTRLAEGTGLGLTITNYLVQMHGGIITVESELGKGSTFTVRLPVEQLDDEGALNIS
jgi:PAS domain S-box-containing protein